MIRRPVHALVALLLLAIEAGIAAFVHDGLVRPYLGDGLAVMLVHAAVRATMPIGRYPAAMAALATGCAIEALQAFHLVDALDLSASPLARTVLGTGFDLWDFGAYAVGAGVAAAFDTGPGAPSTTAQRWRA